MNILLKDEYTTTAGEKFPAGTFLDVDEQVGKELIEDGTAIAQTPEEAAKKEADKITAQLKADRLDKRSKSRANIVIVQDADDKDPMLGFKSTGEMLVAAKSVKGSNAVHPLVEKLANYTKINSEITDADGGFLAPVALAAGILEAGGVEDAVVKPRAFNVPMTTRAIKFNAFVDEDHSTNINGLTVYRPGEGGTKTAGSGKFKQIELNPHKTAILVAVTDELLEDVSAMGAIVSKQAGTSLSWQEDEDYINGTGVGQPLGVFGSPARIDVAKEGGQAADTIVTENILKMWSRCHPRSMAKAVWIVNQTCLPQLYSLTIAVGAGGTVVGLLRDGAVGSPYQTMFGRPVIVTEKCQTLGDVGDIMLVDFSQYAIGTIGGLKADQSIHFYFDTDKTAFRFVMRYDGQCTWTTPMTPANGSTVSPIVRLAERA